MAMRYVLHKNPVAPGKQDKKGVHARVYHNSKLDMDKLCELISVRSSLSSADVKGVLDSFQFWMGVYMADGSTVELKELGHFYPTLKSKCYTNKEGEPCVAIKVDTIKFRCSPKLKKRIRAATLVEEKVAKRNPYSPAKRKTKIIEYVKSNLSINSTTAMRLNKCSRQTALDDLKLLSQEGIIIRAGNGKASIYISSGKE